MQVTRALEYANRAMVHLAANHGNGPMLVADIAKATFAPQNFLHQVLNSLARAGLLVCRRGRTRGYELAREPKEISLFEVFEVVEGPLALSSCTMEGAMCPRSRGCSLASVWGGIQDSMANTLKEATLDKLAPEEASPRPGCPVGVD